MKIFSNFDTKLRKTATQDYVEKYGSDKVMCFGRGRLYWFIRVFFPLLFLLLIDIVIISAFYYVFDGEYFWILIVSVFVLSLFFLIPILGKWIDYKMDFIIVIPDSLMMYDQTGIFTKKVVTVNEKSIKTISVERKGVLYSIFNNGDIIVLSEGDMDHGEITLRRVPKPEEVKKQIAQILKKTI